MSLRFDATLKDLASEAPRAIVSTFDGPSTEAIRLLNVDLSTVTTSTDVVVGLGEPLREVIHFDFQASAAANKHADVLVYNALLHRQHHVSVHTIVVLLRPAAEHRNMNGTVAYAARPGRGKMDFGYEIVRLWEIPAEQFLTGDLGMLPLAILGQLPAATSVEYGLMSVVQRLVERLEREAPVDQTRRLLTAAFVLTGLRITEKSEALQLFQGVRAMRESVTYMAIIDEGRVEEARKVILGLGGKRFGTPADSTKTTITAIDDIERLEYMIERILDAANWQELLAS